MKALILIALATGAIAQAGVVHVATYPLRHPVKTVKTLAYPLRHPVKTLK